MTENYTLCRVGCNRQIELLHEWPFELAASGFFSEYKRTQNKLVPAAANLQEFPGAPAESY